MTVKGFEQIIVEVNFVLFTQIRKLSEGDLLLFEKFMNKYNDTDLDEDGCLRAVVLSYINLFKKSPELMEEKFEQVTQLKLL